MVAEDCKEKRVGKTKWWEKNEEKKKGASSKTDGDYAKSQVPDPDYVANHFRRKFQTSYSNIPFLPLGYLVNALIFYEKFEIGF